MIMKQKERLLEIAKENNGGILSKQVTKLGISRLTIKEMSDSGIYVTKDGYVDEFFLMGQKF